MLYLKKKRTLAERVKIIQEIDPGVRKRSARGSGLKS
jgi:hypothetical protein